MKIEELNVIKLDASCVMS